MCVRNANLRNAQVCARAFSLLLSSAPPTTPKSKQGERRRALAENKRSGAVRSGVGTIFRAVCFSPVAPRTRGAAARKNAHCAVNSALRSPALSAQNAILRAEAEAGPQGGH